MTKPKPGRTVSVSKTVEVDVDVDVNMEDFDTDELLAELEAREKNELTGNSGMLVNYEDELNALYMALRMGNDLAAKQLLRDLMWNTIGRIL